MAAFSGLKAMGIAPKSVDSYYGDDKPVGWSIDPINYQGGYSSPPIRPYYLDPVEEQKRAAAQMAQQLEFNRLQNTMQNYPQMQKLEDIEREERMKSGLERLNQLKTRQDIQNQFQQGQIDYWTPEGRRQLTKAVGMGALTPSALNAIRASSPKAEALESAAYDFNNADTPEKIAEILQSADKSLHIEPAFRSALHDAQHRVARQQAENDNSLINKAIQSQMDFDEMAKYMNPEMTKITDRGAFLKSYNQHLRTEHAKSKILTPSWIKKDEELQEQAMNRANALPPSIEELNAMTGKQPGQVTEQDRKDALERWRNEPLRQLANRKQYVQSYINEHLGIAPPIQQEPANDFKSRAINLIKNNAPIK